MTRTLILGLAVLGAALTASVPPAGAATPTFTIVTSDAKGLGFKYKGKLYQVGMPHADLIKGLGKPTKEDNSKYTLRALWADLGLHVMAKADTKLVNQMYFKAGRGDGYQDSGDMFSPMYKVKFKPTTFATDDGLDQSLALSKLMASGRPMLEDRPNSISKYHEVTYKAQNGKKMMWTFTTDGKPLMLSLRGY